MAQAMKVVLALALLAPSAAFAPHAAPPALRALPSRSTGRRSVAAALTMALPVTELTDGAAAWLAYAPAVDFSVLLSDALESAPFPDSSAAAGAAAAAAPGGGPIDFLAGGIEGAIKYLATTLNGAGIEAAFGPSIILFTLFIKLITFPLNYQQISSTTKMQALQPRTKQIQAQYKDDPSTMNMMLSQLYQENDVNPLAGCFPALAQVRSSTRIPFCARSTPHNSLVLWQRRGTSADASRPSRRARVFELASNARPAETSRARA